MKPLQMINAGSLPLRDADDALGVVVQALRRAGMPAFCRDGRAGVLANWRSRKEDLRSSILAIAQSNIVVVAYGSMGIRGCRGPFVLIGLPICQWPTVPSPFLDRPAAGTSLR